MVVSFLVVIVRCHALRNTIHYSQCKIDKHGGRRAHEERVQDQHKALGRKWSARVVGSIARPLRV